MRSDIADKHFDGNCSFEITDIASVSSDYGGDLDVGGFDSGGGDGGSD